MILITYAYPSEIKELKRLVCANGSSTISWLNWRSGRPLPELKSANIKLLINVGFAGSLCKDMKKGEIVLVKEIIINEASEPYSSLDCDYIQAARSFANSNNVKEIRLFTSSQPVIDTRQKEHILRSSKAHAVDMEAGYLLKQARDKGIPFISFKIISDHADADAWNDIKENLHVYSKDLADKVYEFLRQGSWI